MIVASSSSLTYPQCQLYRHWQSVQVHISYFSLLLAVLIDYWLVTVLMTQSVIEPTRKSKVMAMDSNGRWFMEDYGTKLHLVRWSCVKGATERTLVFHKYGKAPWWFWGKISTWFWTVGWNPQHFKWLSRGTCQRQQVVTNATFQIVIDGLVNSQRVFGFQGARVTDIFWSEQSTCLWLSRGTRPQMTQLFIGRSTVCVFGGTVNMLIAFKGLTSTNGHWHN